MSFGTSTGGLTLVLDGLIELVTELSSLSNNKRTGLGGVVIGETVAGSLEVAGTSITFLVL